MGVRRVFEQLSGQILAPENKPLFGYFGKGGYNAASLEDVEVCKNLHSRNQLGAKSVKTVVRGGLIEKQAT